MKKLFLSITLAAGLLGIASNGHAQVEYVKVCSLYGAAFHYIPGTDICLNEQTGETREQTAGGTWYSVLPTNNQGHWATVPQLDCAGTLVKVGTFKASDFKLNAHEKYQAPPLPFKLQPGQFISKVMMSGGFYDPLQPLASGPQLSPQQFCLRVGDPNFLVSDMGSVPLNPTFCTPAPLACVSNSQIAGTPAAYSSAVLGAPVVHYNTDSNGRQVGQPMTCGSQLVVTTGMGNYNPTTTSDPSQANPIPAGGTLTAWACVEQSLGISTWPW
ncbi:MAG: porin [Candidatus Sulfopaludibacter sp.]|nr:porin [Candidatus Sulfopaludibacter sp.]